jgi:hypothetical protein
MNVPSTVARGLTLPDSLTAIGKAAFCGCAGLASVAYRAEVVDDAFADCPAHVERQE